MKRIFPEIEKVTFNLSENGFIRLLKNAVQKHNSSVAFPKFKKRKEAIYEAKIRENLFSQRTRLYGLKNTGHNSVHWRVTYVFIRCDR